MKQVFVLPVLFCSLNIYAQSIKSVKGLTTVEFSLAQGKIRVYVPAEMTEGEMVTGSIGFEPYGDKERQRVRAMKDLLKNSIRIGDHNESAQALSNKLNVEQTSQIIPFIKVVKPFIISISNNTGDVQTVSIEPFSEKAGPANRDEPCVIPTHALTLAPFNIYGSFDGDGTNTQISINNKPAILLAEKPGRVIALYPGNLEGLAFVHIQEKDLKVCVQNVSSVVLSVIPGKTNLRKGESTWVEIVIKGLENLKTAATLTVTNQSPDIITLEGGEKQDITIQPPKNIEKYVFQKRLGVECIRNGKVIINADFDLPDQFAQSNNANAKDSINQRQ